MPERDQPSADESGPDPEASQSAGASAANQSAGASAANQSAGASAANRSPSDSRPAGADTGTAAFLDALNVRRNARRGFAFGVVFAVAVYVYFVAIPGTYRSQLYYVALGFVLAVGVGGLATTVLLLASVRRLAKEL